MSYVNDGEYPNGNAFYYHCRPPARVYVDGEEIPVINKGVKTQSRSDGPLDINKISDVYFPLEWQGEDIAGDIDAYHPDEDQRKVWQPVEIKYLLPETDEYITYHRGFAMGYGAGSKGTLERRLRVGDPGMLLSNIPFSKRYSRGASIGDILTDLISKFNNHQDVFDVVDVEYISQDVFADSTTVEDRPAGYKAVTNLLTQSVTDFFTGSGKKNFKNNRHTLRDAINFVTQRLDGDLYFKPYGDDPSELVLAYDENRNTTFTPKHLGDDYGPTVIQNNSLYEIQPINAIEVRGQAGRGVLDGVSDKVTGNKGTYPYAVARHKRLYNLAGSEYKPPYLEINATTISDAKAVAREKLMEEIEGGGMGEIILHQYPLIDVRDSIESKPACGQHVDQNVPPITYSIDEVTHRVGYDEESDNMFRRTHLRVNTHVTSEDIEIVESDEQKI